MERGDPEVYPTYPTPYDDLVSRTIIFFHFVQLHIIRETRLLVNLTGKFKFKGFKTSVYYSSQLGHLTLNARHGLEKTVRLFHPAQGFNLQAILNS